MEDSPVKIQRDSMAAPEWQAPRRVPFRVLFVEEVVGETHFALVLVRGGGGFNGCRNCSEWIS